MCSGLWVGAVPGAAVRGVFGENRWPSEGGYLDLAGEEVRFFSCSKYGMCCMVLAYLL